MNKHYRSCVRLALAWRHLPAEDVAELMSIAMRGKAVDERLLDGAEDWRDGVIAMAHAPIPFACSFQWGRA